MSKNIIIDLYVSKLGEGYYCYIMVIVVALPVYLIQRKVKQASFEIHSLIMCVSHR